MTLQDISALWSMRSRRERHMLTGLAGLLVALIAWYGLVAPAMSWREAAAGRLRTAVARSGQVHAALMRLKALEDTTQSTSNLTVDQAARQAAEAAGLEVQINVTEDDAAAFTVASTPTGPLFAWLGLLESDYGVQPSRLTIIKATGGLQVEGVLPAPAD